MPKNVNELSEFHLDALQEVGNIGAGSAAVALTNFLNRSTYMNIPNVAVDNIETITRLVKMPINEDVAIISSNTSGKLLYTVLVFFDKLSVQKIIDLMTEVKQENEKELKNLSPLFKSLIKEVGSILALKYIEALNSFLKTDSFPSPPKLRIGTVNSIGENELKNVNVGESSVLFIECDVFTSEKTISVDLAIVPHQETLSEFMKLLFKE
ncbi:MAG: chemotaxis protein CheC [Candidatus Hodarchaeales archaeon]